MITISTIVAMTTSTITLKMRSNCSIAEMSAGDGNTWDHVKHLPILYFGYCSQLRVWGLGFKGCPTLRQFILGVRLRSIHN